MRRFILIVFCTSLLSIVGTASACGGFFCTNVPIDQSAERIIFTINGDDTISAIVGINYEGAAEEFSWVVPVPSPPELDVAPTSTLNILQNTTNPQFNVPRNYCRGVVWSDGGLGGGGGDYLEQGNVGPYDYAIIASDNPAELIEWLRDNGYRVTDDMQPIIAEYVFEGMYFLAMKLSNDAEVGDIQPVKMTYNSKNPMIPLRLTAVAALDDMPVLVWVFADQPYSPENYVHAEVDFASFRATSQLISPWDFDNPIGKYIAEQGRIQEEYGGQAFITEYAMPSRNLLELDESIVNETYLLDLIHEYPFVTRLRAQLSPEQMTVDPVLIPDADQEHVPQMIDLTNYVDPLHYWGCSNRERTMTSYEDLLPNSTLLLPENLTFRYPEGWVQSNLTFNDVELEAYAPKVVQAEDIAAFFAGESNFPIFIRYLNIDNVGYWYQYPLILNLGDDYKLPEALFHTRYGMNALFSNSDDDEIVFSLLTTDEDWEQNKHIYGAMGSYLETYAYYAHPKLRYTFALAQVPEGYSDSLLLGFPEGWTEHIVPNKREVQINISAQITPDDGSSLQIDIDPSSLEIIFSEYTKDEILANQMDRELIEELGITDETLDTIITEVSEACARFPIVDYDHNGRKGYFRVAGGWLVVVSGTPEEFEANQETMRWIAESVSDGYQMCG